MSYNGAAVVAMKGKDCVAIAADRRFGIQAQTLAMDFQKIFEMGPRLYVGLPGLATDVQTVYVEQIRGGGGWGGCDCKKPHCIPRTKYERGILWFSRHYVTMSAAVASADTS